MTRVVLVGAGAMGRAWLSAIAENPGVELAGVVDLDLDAARRAAPGLPTGTDVVSVAARAGADAVINVTVPAAHHAVTTAALFAGFPVLGEKPVADTVARALSLTAAAEAGGRLFMVSQSRRWNPQLFTLRDMTAGLGPIATVGTEFFRAPHFGGFREEMAQPLLVDMAIHAFDSARFLLGADPVQVSCQTWNPSWSWFAGDACAAAVFEMTGGARYVYHGSWCAPGPESSWNGSWRVVGQEGTALWDGDHDPVGPSVPAVEAPSGIAGALSVFVEALRTGETPMGEVHGNVLSLAMVEAAVRSSAEGRPVMIDDVLSQAHSEALRDETRPEVRKVLQGWTDVRAALG
ncbi:Gfo/Idh/MocA family protein [Actinoplanes friuliensis]|uniref:Oxidoreductase domain-containing protein n=1 Tax=Actinoplanes friuliensis DSM 7358 TaxID=1246995 RepID=U5W3Y7_9ACTN|nr:Gfo/Idh/MocA family oxidoreductase [Actinoplanes friuliensis]AGZ43737.1 oxidoreductase domain-containing protein [Actinoplanes friuliensis DSM 7358]